jgi:hypothetical protein
VSAEGHSSAPPAIHARRTVTSGPRHGRILVNTPVANASALPVSGVSWAEDSTPARSALRLRALERWHLLSLDAPTVSALWTWFVARSFGVHATPATLAAMFVAVWMLYAGDRLLDARAARHNPSVVLEDRHRFHALHARAFTIALFAAAFALALLLPAIPHALLARYAGLSALLALWLATIHRSRRPALLPKELAVGVFFALACVLPAQQAGAPLLGAAATVLALTLMCCGNCFFLFAWEAPHTTAAIPTPSAGPATPAHWSAHLSARYLPRLAVAAILVCIAAASLHLRDRAIAAEPALAASLSIALLLLLHRLRARIAPTTLRALADAALLTPLLFAIPLRALPR